MQPAHFKSGSLRRKSVRLASRVTLHFVKRNPKQAHCAVCGKPLHGIPRNVKRLSKSEKTVERRYGGYLCTQCARRRVIEEFRGE